VDIVGAYGQDNLSDQAPVFMIKKMIKNRLLIIIFLILSQQIAVSQDGLAGHWDFNDPLHPEKAVIGNDLIQQGGGVSIIDGPADDDGAVQVAKGTYFIAPHGIDANGGGNRVNEFSIVMDIQLPEPELWQALYQTDATNRNDGECFISPNTVLGIGNTGYTTYRFNHPNEWYRIVISVKNNIRYNYYSDGVKRLDGTPQDIDGRFSLGSVVLFFADENGEDNAINVSDIKLFSKALNDSEVYALGGFSHTKPPVYTDSLINPYLQSPTPTSVYINWHANPGEESIVEYGTDESLGSIEKGTVYIFEDSTRWWHTVKLTNLTPFTTYYYKAKTDSFESKIFKFRTPPDYSETNGHLRFVVLGDSRTTPEKFSQIIDSMSNTVNRLYNVPIEESLNLIFNVGDIVTNGYELSQYKTEYFEPLKIVSRSVPVMVSIGNHEMESEHFYNYMKYEDFEGAEGEKYYSFRIGRALFVSLNSNWQVRNSTQIDWLDALLHNAQNDDTIDWVFSFCHHPGHTELYPGGCTDYVQDRIIPTLKKYSKVDILFYGHTHDYERGALQDGNLRFVLSGGGGSDLNRWKYRPLSDLQNYPEIQKTYDYYNYSVVDIDVEKKTYSIKTYALGNKDKFMANVLVDSFYRDKTADAPPKPELIAPETGTSQTPPFQLLAEDFTIQYDIMSSRFQITDSSGHYDNPLIDKISDFEDFFGDTGSPDYEAVNLNKDINLSKFLVTGKGLQTGKTYWWRMRYRDKNLQWSEWSDERSFTNGDPVGLSEYSTAVVKENKLYANYPNPFNPATNIRFSVKYQGNVTLKIYSIDGRLVKTLINSEISSGEYSIRWNGKDNNGVPVPSGTYLYRIEAPNYTKTMKALLIK
jgi:hypothetical protein